MSSQDHTVSRGFNRLTIHRYDLESVFDVAVGKPPFRIKRFVLHTEVFKDRTALLDVERSEDDTVVLINEDPEIFLSYLNIVYFGKNALEQSADIPMPDPSPEAPLDARQDVADLQFEKLIRLYLLADSLEDVETANMIVDEIIRFSDAVDLVPTQTPVNLIYNSTPRYDALRPLMVEMWTYARHAKHVRRIRTGEFPQEFIYEITLELFLAVRTDDRDRLDVTVKDRWDEDPCEYHVHKADTYCGSHHFLCKWITCFGNDLRCASS